MNSWIDITWEIFVDSKLNLFHVFILLWLLDIAIEGIFAGRIYIYYRGADDSIILGKPSKLIGWLAFSVLFTWLLTFANVLPKAVAFILTIMFWGCFAIVATVLAKKDLPQATLKQMITYVSRAVILGNLMGMTIFGFDAWGLFGPEPRMSVEAFVTLALTFLVAVAFTLLMTKLLLKKPRRDLGTQRAGGWLVGLVMSVLVGYSLQGILYLFK